MFLWRCTGSVLHRAIAIGHCEPPTLMLRIRVKNGRNFFQAQIFPLFKGGLRGIFQLIPLHKISPNPSL